MLRGLLSSVCGTTNCIAPHLQKVNEVKNVRMLTAWEWDALGGNCLGKEQKAGASRLIWQAFRGSFS